MERVRIWAQFSMLVVATVCVGCTDTGNDSNAFTVRDSSGVSIAENRAATWTGEDGWSIEGEPFVSLAGNREAAEYEFFQVVSAVRTDDGTIIVADRGSRTVRWYDADGTHRHSAGGAGDGPGEFRTLAWVGVIGGDSVHVWDNQAGRVSVFVDGAFVRDYRPQSPDQQASFSVYGALSDGSLAAMSFAVPTPGDTPLGVHRPPVPIWVVTASGAVAVELGEFPSSAVEYRTSATPGAVLRGVVPFGARTLLAADGDQIIVGDNASYELRVHDRAGVLTRIVRVDELPEPVRPEDLETELQRRLESAPPVDEIRAGIRVNFEATPAPEMMPLYDRLFVDSEGHLWVRREAETLTRGARWDIVGPDGRLMGSVLSPPALQLTQIGRDFVVGISTDDMGVEDVRVFRLSRQ